MVKVTVDEKKNQITIVADLDPDPQPSKSGKTLILASTGGNLTTDQKYKGKPVIVGLNAYIKRDGQPA